MSRSLEATRNCPRFPLVPTPETIGRLGISFRPNDAWDRLGGQALLIIGCLGHHPPKRSRHRCTESLYPFPNSFWSGEFLKTRLLGLISTVAQFLRAYVRKIYVHKKNRGNARKVARKRKSWTSLNFSFKLSTFSSCPCFYYLRD